jgi:hypothetical protein
MSPLCNLSALRRGAGPSFQEQRKKNWRPLDYLYLRGKPKGPSGSYRQMRGPRTGISNIDWMFIDVEWYNYKIKKT